MPDETQKSAVLEMPQPQPQLAADQVAEKMAANTSASGPATADPNIAEVVTFVRRVKPTVEQVVQDMAMLAKFINKYAGGLLLSEMLSNANPAIQGLNQAGSSLEQGAIQLHMLIQQHKQQQQAGMVDPRAVRMPGGPGSQFPN